MAIWWNKNKNKLDEIKVKVKNDDLEMIANLSLYFVFKIGKVILL